MANLLGSNSGSLESFQYRKRWGWMDSADRTDWTTPTPTPRCRARVRTLQWVPTDSGGVLQAVAAMRWRVAGSYFRFRPRPGWSARPARRWAANRRRHLITTGLDTFSLSWICSLRRPSAASSTMRARRTSRCAEEGKRVMLSKVARSSEVSSIGGARRDLIEHLRSISLISQSIYVTQH